MYQVVEDKTGKEIHVVDTDGQLRLVMLPMKLKGITSMRPCRCQEVQKIVQKILCPKQPNKSYLT